MITDNTAALFGKIFNHLVNYIISVLKLVKLPFPNFLNTMCICFHYSDLLNYKVHSIPEDFF